MTTNDLGGGQLTLSEKFGKQHHWVKGFMKVEVRKSGIVSRLNVQRSAAGAVQKKKLGALHTQLYT